MSFSFYPLLGTNESKSQRPNFCFQPYMQKPTITLMSVEWILPVTFSQLRVYVNALRIKRQWLLQRCYIEQCTWLQPYTSWQMVAISFGLIVRKYAVKNNMMLAVLSEVLLFRVSFALVCKTLVFFSQPHIIPSPHPLYYQAEKCWESRIIRQTTQLLSHLLPL